MFFFLHLKDFNSTELIISSLWNISYVFQLTYILKRTGKAPSAKAAYCDPLKGTDNKHPLSLYMSVSPTPG